MNCREALINWSNRSLTFQDVSDTRLNNFDALRLFLAALVIWSHCYPLLGLNSFEPIRLLCHAQSDGGKIAVELFFAVSGFLIAKSWMQSRSPKDYIRKRVLRIYPRFIVALAFCC